MIDNWSKNRLAGTAKIDQQVVEIGDQAVSQMDRRADGRKELRVLFVTKNVINEIDFELSAINEKLLPSMVQ
jgi:hypothetical protein